MRMFRSCRFVVLAAGLAVASGGIADACSRVVWPDTGRGVYVGRNMDWFEDLRSNMWILPRGMERTAAVDVNPLTWTTKYGSFVITAYDAGVADGVNEKGLAGHMLYLPETATAPRDSSLPGLSLSEWVGFYLDNFATVAEAVAYTQEHPFQLRMTVEPQVRRPPRSMWPLMTAAEIPRSSN